MHFTIFTKFKNILKEHCNLTLLITGFVIFFQRHGSLTFDFKLGRKMYFHFSDPNKITKGI